MKRIIAAILGISFVFTVCSCNRKIYKDVKIGIIDSCISKEIQEEMKIVQINDIVQNWNRQQYYSWEHYSTNNITGKPELWDFLL